jgi:chromosome segregation ATPase
VASSGTSGAAALSPLPGQPPKIPRPSTRRRLQQRRKLERSAAANYESTAVILNERIRNYQRQLACATARTDRAEDEARSLYQQLRAERENFDKELRAERAHSEATCASLNETHALLLSAAENSTLARNEDALRNELRVLQAELDAKRAELRLLRTKTHSKLLALSASLDRNRARVTQWHAAFTQSQAELHQARAELARLREQAAWPGSPRGT